MPVCHINIINFTNLSYKIIAAPTAPSSWESCNYWRTCIEMRLLRQYVPFFAMNAFIAWILERKRIVAILTGSLPSPALKQTKYHHLQRIVKSNIKRIKNNIYLMLTLETYWRKMNHIHNRTRSDPNLQTVSFVEVLQLKSSKKQTLLDNRLRAVLWQ